MNNTDRPMYLPLTWKDEEPAMSKKLVMVEALTIYRMRYVVECNEVDHATEVVKLEELQDEFSQLHLGEMITSTREISREEYLKLFNEDNDYLRGWTDEEKFKLVHKIDYDK